MWRLSTLPHRRLLSKLHSYKFSDQMCKWIQDLLYNRKQIVSVNGENSGWCPVISGISRGSVLGPLLFVTFINDLPNTVSSNVFLYVDDTKIFNTMKSNVDVQRLQKDLDNLEGWTNVWLLKFHPEKCKHMRIGRKSDSPCRDTI